jgi:hypothetical protein
MLFTAAQPLYLNTDSHAVADANLCIALQADEPAWPAHEDFVFTIHPNSKEQLVLTLLHSDRLRFFKYSVCRSMLAWLYQSQNMWGFVLHKAQTRRSNIESASVSARADIHTAI